MILDLRCNPARLANDGDPALLVSAYRKRPVGTPFQVCHDLRPVDVDEAATAIETGVYPSDFFEPSPLTVPPCTRSHDPVVGSDIYLVEYRLVPHAEVRQAFSVVSYTPVDASSFEWRMYLFLFDAPLLRVNHVVLDPQGLGPSASAFLGFVNRDGSILVQDGLGGQEDA